MAWDVCGNTRYYTRSRRVDGRVTREYYGKGEAAHLAAALDAQKRQQREAQLAARRHDRERWQAACAPLDQVIEDCTLFVQAALIAGGYHRRNKGHWRRVVHERSN